MRMVTMKEFLELPPNTVYADYINDSACFGDWSIKRDTVLPGSWIYIDLTSLPVDGATAFKSLERLEKGENLPTDFTMTDRDTYREGRRFVVLDKDDVCRLIEALLPCSRSAVEPMMIWPAWTQQYADTFRGRLSLKEVQTDEVYYCRVTNAIMSRDKNALLPNGEYNTNGWWVLCSANGNVIDWSQFRNDLLARYNKDGV